MPTGSSMSQPCPSSPESSTVSSGEGCRRPGKHCRGSTGRERCRSARGRGGSPRGTPPRSASLGSTGTGEEGRGSTSSRSRWWTARAPGWKPGKTADSQIIWPVRVRQLQELVRRLAHSIPCRPHRSCSLHSTSPIRTSRREAFGRIFASGWPRRRRSTENGTRQEVFGGFTRWRAAGTVAQPWAHDDEATTPAYSPEAASVLLTEAGWIDYDGDGVREDVNGWQLRPVAIVREDSRPELAAVMARVARDLAAVGMALQSKCCHPTHSTSGGSRVGTTISLRTPTTNSRGLPTSISMGRRGTFEPTRQAGIRAATRTPTRMPRSTNFSAPSLSSVKRPPCGACNSVVNEDLFGLWLGFPDDLVLVAAGIEGFAPDMAWQTARTWDLWRAPQESLRPSRGSVYSWLRAGSAGEARRIAGGKRFLVGLANFGLLCSLFRLGRLVGLVVDGVDHLPQPSSFSRVGHVFSSSYGRCTGSRRID